MAVTANWYGLGMKGIATGLIDLDTDTFKAMLATSSYAPNQDTDQFRSSVTANEISGTGYSAGGVALASVSVSYDAATNEVRWTAANPSWTSSSFTARYLVIYKSRGGADTADDLVMYVNFGADETVASGTFTYTVPATGLAKITCS
jgi:hypothetical protein